MSPLTKLFVGLLVVLSLLQSAGIIVFVNTQSDHKTAAETAKDALARMQSDLDRRIAETDTIRATADQQA